MKMRLEFKPQDLYLGVYWETKAKHIECSMCGDSTYDHYCNDRTEVTRHVWLLLCPMLPIHFWWRVS